MFTLLSTIIAGAMALHAAPDYCQQASVNIYDRQGGGFVIVRSDGHVVGFSDHGTVDDALQNSNLTNWLRGYCCQRVLHTDKQESEAPTDCFKWAPSTDSRQARRNGVATAVSPMLTSQWGQTEPYWNLCPTDAEGYPCHTGCVATAMAQVMRYHQWPATSQGTGHYFHPTTGNTPYEFGGQPYAWHLMADSYKTAATTGQQQAVALLMHECGAAVNMQYTSFGSSAYVSRVARGLVENMGYSRRARYLRREWMSSDEWDRLLRSELEAGRPVVFGGQSQTFGHCFVVDGIDAAGLLHVNWGWEGNGDGYYDVNYMFPTGDTEATSGFNYTQELVIGICPPGDDEAQYSFRPCLYLKDGLSFSNATPKRTGSFTLTLNNVYNSIGTRFDGLIGIALCQDGQMMKVLKTATLTLDDLGTVEKKTLMLSVPADVAEGDYELRAVSQESGDDEWTEMATRTGSQGYVALTVTTDALHLSATHDEPLLAVTGLGMVRHRVLPGSETEVTLSVSNEGGAIYNGQVGLALVDGEGRGVWSQVKPLMAYDGRTIETGFTVTVPTEEGVYHFVPAYLDIATESTVYFPPNDTVDMTLEVTAEAVSDMRPDLAISQVEHVRKTANTLYRFSACVTNNGREKANEFVLNYHVDDNTPREKTFSVNLLPGESTTVYISVSTLKKAGKHYFNYAVTTVDGAADIDPSNSMGTTTVKVVGTLYDRTSVIEEGTGTWCGYCPRGMVALDAMHQQYGHRLITIAVHSGDDPLICDSYTAFADSVFTSYPSCVVNRGQQGTLSPTIETLQQAIDYYVSQKADALLSIEEAILTDDGSEIETTVNVTFGYPDDKARYRVAIVLVEDSVDTDSDGQPLLQTNYYAGGKNGPMGGWEQRADEEPWVYYDVARQLYGDSHEGFDDSLPLAVERDVTYTFRTSLSVPATCRRLSCLRLVAMVIDTDTHEVMNACAGSVVPGASGINEVGPTTAAGQHIAYDLQGRRAERLMPGHIYIVDGRKTLK